MVDVMRSVSAATPIETPAAIHLANSQHRAMRSPTRFGVGNFLARVLGDLVLLLERNGGKAAFAVYTRRLDG